METKLHTYAPPSQETPLMRHLKSGRDVQARNADDTQARGTV